MKKISKQLFIALCLFAAPLGVTAQSLVFHLAGGEKTTVVLPATFTVTPRGNKLVIAVDGSDDIELSKDEIMCVTYRDAKGDVNGDQRVDVADVSTLVGLLIGKEEQAYLTCPNENHPHLIDLGLPSGTQWRCCNEGASTPDAYGGYYTFGQVSTAPSLDQIKELLNNTTSVWTTQNGVNGRKFTGRNGGTIFLPAAGFYCDGEINLVGDWGNYWSSTPYDEGGTYVLDFGSYNADCGVINYRSDGRSVRPVR